MPESRPEQAERSVGLTRPVAALFGDAYSALRSGSDPPNDLTPSFDNHEEALRRFWQTGTPSGDGKEQFDSLVEMRERDLEEELRLKRVERIANITLKFALSLALISIALERFTS